MVRQAAGRRSQGHSQGRSPELVQERSQERASVGCLQSVPARITLLYESRDGRLCLFQDAQGHLTAVRSSQLA